MTRSATLICYQTVVTHLILVDYPTSNSLTRLENRERSQPRSQTREISLYIKRELYRTENLKLWSVQGPQLRPRAKPLNMQGQSRVIIKHSRRAVSLKENERWLRSSLKTLVQCLGTLSKPYRHKGNQTITAILCMIPHWFPCLCNIQQINFCSQLNRRMC